MVLLSRRLRKCPQPSETPILASAPAVAVKYPLAGFGYQVTVAQVFIMQVSNRVQSMSESATLAVASRAAQMIAQGEDVVSFGAGEPDFDTPEHIKQAAADAIFAGHTKYPKPSSGLAAAKQAVCRKYAVENGVEYSPEQVIITVGGKNACQLAALAVLNPGDEVIIPVPYWVSYPEFVKLAGATAVFVRGEEANDFRMTPQQLEAAITDKTRALFFNSPSNPGGFTYDPDQVRAIAGVLADRDIWVFSDEIYERLRYHGQEYISFAAVSEQARAQTITLNGASKTYSMTGWRIGYAVGPTDAIKGMAKLQSQGTSGAPTFCQFALAAALNDDQEPVEAMRRVYEVRATHLHRRICALPDVTCVKPTGAFVAFPNVSATYQRLGVSGSAEFCEKVLNEINVALVPGIAFGSDDHVRFSFACSMETIDEGLDRMARFLA